MHHVFALEVDWNGSLLIARPQFGDGWRLMANRPLMKLHTRSIQADELGDLSPFELGVFLADVCREFTLAWEIAREEELQAAALFDELPGERS